MDFFDEHVLAALKDGKPRGFTVLLGEVGFTHNSLQQHLNRLVARGLVVKEKMASNSLGRPKFAYHVPSTAAKQVTAALQNPHEALVTLQFSRLRHVCRFEKSGYCKEAKKNCEPQNCPQTRKQKLQPFYTNFETSQRATVADPNSKSGTKTIYSQ